VNELFSTLAEADARHVVLWSDASSGLRAILVIDDVTLGPAAGGIRTQPYPSVRDAMLDAAHLAQNMTLKCALAGLDVGGGKVVVLDHANMDRERAFYVLGQRIEELGGVFRTGPDLGTTTADLTHVARGTQFVNHDEIFPQSVAQGLLRCLEACATYHGAKGLEGLRIAIQGCGSIGAAVARTLTRAGAKLVLADVNVDRAERLAHDVGGRVCEADEVLGADVDIVAPCAVGGVLTVPRAEALRAWAVCGAANNILAEPAVATILHRRKILHVPDAIASAGAVVDGIGRTVMRLPDRTHLIDGLGRTALEVLQEAERQDRTSLEIAEERAHARIAAHKALQAQGRA
jgi:leucine dehydrogenase